MMFSSSKTDDIRSSSRWHRLLQLMMSPPPLDNVASSNRWRRLLQLTTKEIRRSLLNEDESSFRKAKRPIYYDDGLEKTRQTPDLQRLAN